VNDKYLKDALAMVDPLTTEEIAGGLRDVGIAATPGASPAPDSAASASGEKQYCSVCGVVESGYHQSECLYIGVVTTAECRAAQPVQAGVAVDENLVLIPRGLIGSACYALHYFNPKSKLVLKLREYTTGAKSARAVLIPGVVKPTQTEEAVDERAEFERMFPPPTTDMHCDDYDELVSKRAEQWDVWLARASLAPVAAQQGAADPAQVKELIGQYRTGYRHGLADGQAEIAAKAPAAQAVEAMRAALNALGWAGTTADKREAIDLLSAVLASPASTPEATQSDEQKGGAK
jgi:hypothetical protein